jgi:hypothetical protein
MISYEQPFLIKSLFDPQLVLWFLREYDTDRWEILSLIVNHMSLSSLFNANVLDATNINRTTSSLPLQLERPD